MQFKKILTRRATRATISISLVVISIVAMVNAPDVSNSLLAITMFAIANIIHIICDKLWSWLLVLPFIIAYIILLWVNFFSDYYLLGSKYSMGEYTCQGGLFVCIGIILLFICYLLKPSSKEVSISNSN
jgi:hypothetical protein